MSDIDLRNPITIATVFVIGICVQLIDGSLGMGYGVTSSTLLITAGLAPAIVSASVHMAEMFTTGLSGISHMKYKNVRLDIALPMVGSGMLGGILGAYFLVNSDPKLVKPAVAIILLALGARIFIRYAGITHKTLKFSGKKFHKAHLAPLGFVGGAMDAFGGGGWGPVCTTTLVSTERTEPRYVVGSVNFAEWFVTVAIVVTFAWTLGLEKFLWSVTIPLALGGLIAAPIAAWMCHRVNPYTLGVCVGALLITTNLRTFVTSYPVAADIDPWLKTQTEKDMFLGMTALIMVCLILVIFLLRKQSRIRKLRQERGDARRPRSRRPKWMCEDVATEPADDEDRPVRRAGRADRDADEAPCEDECEEGHHHDADASEDGDAPEDGMFDTEGEPSEDEEAPAPKRPSSGQSRPPVGRGPVRR